MMTPEEFGLALEKTLEDYRLSRSEKRALSELVESVGTDETQLALFRNQVFDKAREALPPDPQSRAVVDWLEAVMKVLQPIRPSTSSAQDRMEAHFSPSDYAVQRLVSFLTFAKTSLDICVFTITDNRLSGAILEAHQRGVAVRIITDDEKSGDLGSDIQELQRAGIEVRMDDTANHMHHKFAIADRSQLLTGSYNWTRSASINNQENYVILGDPDLLSAFQSEFDRLWRQFA